jgi:hypothetical protein
MIGKKSFPLRISGILVEVLVVHLHSQTVAFSAVLQAACCSVA